MRIEPEATEEPFSPGALAKVEKLEAAVSQEELDRFEPPRPSDLQYYSQQQIEAWGVWLQASDKSLRMRTMLDAWREQQGHERRLRSLYAALLVMVLFAQVCMANAAFLLIGYQRIVVSPWVADVFFLGVFGQITSMIFLILRYLFPDKPSGLAELLERL